MTLCVRTILRHFSAIIFIFKTHHSDKRCKRWASQYWGVNQEAKSYWKSQEVFRIIWRWQTEQNNKWEGHSAIRLWSLQGLYQR